MCKHTRHPFQRNFISQDKLIALSTSSHLQEKCGAVWSLVDQAVCKFIHKPLPDLLRAIQGWPIIQTLYQEVGTEGLELLQLLCEVDMPDSMGQQGLQARQQQLYVRPPPIRDRPQSLCAASEHHSTSYMLAKSYLHLNFWYAKSIPPHCTDVHKVLVANQQVETLE
jgi:hypothetical protein